MQPASLSSLLLLTVAYMSVYCIYKIYTVKKGETMHLQLSLGNPLPFYEQVEEQIKQKIITGELKAGESLPSIRTLARDLTTSVITIKRAYQELEGGGWIYTRPGLGTFVCAVDPEQIKREALSRIAEALRTALAEAERGGLNPEQVLRLLEKMISERSRQ
jgi:GntR family transcriptional regulator